MKDDVLRALVFISVVILMGVFVYIFFHSPATSKQPMIILPENPDRFHLAFQNIMKEEGGYVDNPSDPGGETNFGISKQAYPELNIQAITIEDAKNIYRRDYWEKIRGDELHSDALAIELLEEAVNMGHHTAISFLQAAVLASGGKITIDGVMGEKTLTEVKKIDPDALLKCIKSQSLTYYLTLVQNRPILRKFLKGWFNRVLT